MKKIFLETHNIQNQYSGFGQFNLHLLKGLYNSKETDLQFIAHTNNKKELITHFGNYFKYRFYYGFTRYRFASIRKKYDIWHSVNQNTKTEPYYNIPYVLTIHDVNFVEEISNDLSHPRNKTFINKLNRSHAITYISEYAKKVTHQYFDVPNVPEYIIHNGNPSNIKLDISQYKPSFETQGPYLFSIGDFFERKNFHKLVEMMPYLKNYKLIIAGNKDRSYGNRVEETIKKLQLQEKVTLLGRISEEEKQYHLKNCTAFVFPSIREGFGLPPIEAMSFGTPVFLANKTSLPEIGGEYAFYWDDFSPKVMAEILEKSMQKFESNTALFETELKKQAAKFNWDEAAKKYIEVYKSLL
ncbi:MAG: glycosyltransferase family 1 protein [Flavobacteriaceae bacterium]